MKCRIIAVLVLVSVVNVWAQFAYKPLNASIPDSSTLIIPAVDQFNATAFTSNTAVTAGTILSYSNKYYMVLTAGTTTNTLPTHFDGDGTNGTAVLRWVWPKRSSVMLQNSGAGNIYLAYGKTAESGKGLVLLPNYGNAIKIDGITSVYGISDSGSTNTILIHVE